MKNVLKAFSVIALVAVIGFSMAACGGGGGGDDDDDGGSNGGDGWMGSTFKITNAQVYNDMYWDVFNTDTVPNLNYSYYKDRNTSLYELIEGNSTVTLTNGKLNITLGKPGNSSLQDFDLSRLGITVSTTNVQAFTINSFNDDRGDNKITVWQFGVSYIYVDKAVNITGQYTDTNNYGYLYTYNYAMNLKAGWNSVFESSKWIGENTGENTYEIIYQTGKPNATDFKWLATYAK